MFMGEFQQQMGGRFEESQRSDLRKDGCKKFEHEAEGEGSQLCETGGSPKMCVCACTPA